MTITEIRAKFPNPVPVAPHGEPQIPDSYCVGGSLCLAMAEAIGAKPHPQHAWPGYTYLAGVLQDYNPALDSTAAYEYAWKIITDNDNDMIERAWTLAEQALTSTKET